MQVNHPQRVIEEYEDKQSKARTRREMFAQKQQLKSSTNNILGSKLSNSLTAKAALGHGASISTDKSKLDFRP